MDGLTRYQEGIQPLDPLAVPCDLRSSDLEAELRRLFCQISGGNSADSSEDPVSQILGLESLSGSPLVRVDHLETFDRWFQKFCEDPYDLRVLDLKRKIKRLIGKMLEEKITSSSKGISRSPKRKRDPLSDMLLFLKDVALDPGGQREDDSLEELKEQVVFWRQALFLRVSDIPNVDEFPYRKRQKANQLLCGSSHTSSMFLDKSCTENDRRFQSSETLNQHTRRPRRTFALLKLDESTLPRQRIPVGDSFQAAVPKWKEPPIKRDVKEESRWLGTRVWPIKGDARANNMKMIGKGRPDSCTCSSPGSMDCIRFHVSTSRRRLKSELGQAFISLGFDGMGEEVSKLWTDEEQRKFYDIMKLGHLSEDENFWGAALKYFNYKSSLSIASYYFNVFILRLMRDQPSLASGAADSDDDGNNQNTHDDENSFKDLHASYTASPRYLKRRGE